MFGNWTKKEKKIAKKAFELARSRAYKKLIDTINSKVIKTQDDIWELRDMLNKKAKDFNDDFDYRYSRLPLLFVLYINEGLLKIEELEGLSEYKINAIREMVNKN